MKGVIYLITQAQEMLKSYFGYDFFRTGQEQAIELILNQQDAVCVMPTGGGKSICYQIPALMFSGTTIVISPLISLMKDQVDTLQQLGIPATFINSSISFTETQQRIDHAKQGKYKLIYVAPERLDHPSFIEELKNMDIPFLAVDEAHCISQWGHDFRPSYLHIKEILTLLPRRPIVLALTATATPQVREDICQALDISKVNTVITGFERTNLTFSVVKGQDKDAFLQDYVTKNHKEAGIIYAATRKTVDQLYNKLNKLGVEVGRYHAGLSDHERSLQQEKFLNDEITVMVATSAFGMGIDKSNIRYVIHYQMPKNMESYYQEAGRAGRDGLESECILCYSPQDVMIQRFLIEQSTDPMRNSQELKKLRQMTDYCHTENCLQAFIVEYFGEENVESCQRCQNCTDDRQSVDVTRDAQMVLSCVIRMGERFGKTFVAQVLSGSKGKKISEFQFDQLTTYGIMSNRSIKDIGDFIEFLISEELLGVKHGTFPTIYVTNKGKLVLKGVETVKRKEQIVTKVIVKNDPLFEQLRHLRKSIAEEEGVPPFVVFSDDSLRDMCVKLPQTSEDMLTVKGVGAFKKEKYGERFVNEISQYLMDYSDYAPEILVEKETENEIKPRKKSEKNSHLLTYEMYKNGVALTEIANDRELSIQTIESHLIRCYEEGYDVDWLSFIPQENLSLIEAAVQEAGTDKLTPIKELLPDNISYFMIKAYLQMNNLS